MGALTTHPLHSQSPRSGGWFCCLREKRREPAELAPLVTFDTRPPLENIGTQESSRFQVSLHTELKFLRNYGATRFDKVLKISKNFDQ